MTQLLTPSPSCNQLQDAPAGVWDPEENARRRIRPRPEWFVPSPDLPGPLPHDWSMRRRAQKAALCAYNQTHQVLEMRRCKESVVYWVNEWCFTCDQRAPEDMRDSPFDIFAIQMEFLLWIHETRMIAEEFKRRRKDYSVIGLCEKSRGQGASWLAIAYAVWGWLFSPGFVAGFGSLKKEEVDAIGNLSTLLEKARYILRRLPLWMLPSGYDELKNATLGKILNPVNRAAIVGEWGDNMGRGAKASIFFIDESAHLVDSKAVDAALTENANCKIHISTPKGAAGSFYEKRMALVGQGRMWTPQGPIYPGSIFRLHWHDDPRKDEAWRLSKLAELNNDPVLWASEYEIDYSASIEGIVIPAKWVMAAVNLNLPESEGPVVAGLDCSGEGANNTVLIAVRGQHVYMPVSWNGLDTTQSAHKAAQEAKKLNVKELFFDVSGLGAGYKAAFRSFGDLSFTAHPINAGAAATETKWPGGKMSKELFCNLKTEGWAALRMRFEKAYEYKNGLADHPSDEMISLPNCPQLIAELSAPTWEVRETGKRILESKADMRSRGVKSPDFADALVLAYIPRPKKIKFWFS